MTEFTNSSSVFLNTNSGEDQKQSLLLTELNTESKTYDGSNDEYFDYEKQYQKIKSKKRLRQSSIYSEPSTQLPSISMRLLDEAVNLHLLPSEKKEKLIRNPNKYSIFFTKFNCESPSMSQAMKQKNLEERDLSITSFTKFVERYPQPSEDEEFFINKNQDYLKKLIDYLQYVTLHYEKLKDLLALRTSLKKAARQTLLTSRSNGDLSYQYNSSEYYPNSCTALSIMSLNRSFDKSILSLEDRAERHKLKAQKEESALEKYVEQIIQKKKRDEESYQKSLDNAEQRMLKQKKEHLMFVKKKQENHEQKLEKVFEKGRYLQEKREEKILVKFQKMDENYEKAQERKIQFDLKRQEIIQGNSPDSKLAKIKEIREQREVKHVEERDSLLKEIETKNNRSSQLISSQLSSHLHKIQAQREKYHSTMDLIQQKEKDKKQQILQNLVLVHLDVQQKGENKQKLLEDFLKAREKLEKKKNEMHQKVRERLDFLQEKTLEKLATKREKQEEKIETLKKQINDWKQEKHQMSQVTLKRIESNLTVVKNTQDQQSNKVIEKNVQITEKRIRNRDSLERYRNSSRSLHFELSQKKQDVLLKL